LFQVWGRKHWTIRNSPQHLLYTEEMLGKSDPVPPELIGDPIMSFDMQPHDVLFIPRGFLHEARTSAEPSLHITVTVPTTDYCWGVQVAKHLAQQLHRREMPTPLQDLADGSMAQLNNGKDADIQALLRVWLQQVSGGAVLSAFEDRMSGTTLAKNVPFARPCRSACGHVSRSERVFVSCMVCTATARRIALSSLGTVALWMCLSVHPRRRLYGR